MIMGIELLSKRELALINRKKHRYHLAIAEKDYFLAVVSKIIFDSSFCHKLVFKGGTAIHHCYLPQYRFSEDLDFTALDKSITPEEVKAVLENNDFLKVKKEYRSNANIKFEKVQYSGPLGLANHLKVEIDFMQNVLLPSRQIDYKNIWGLKTDVLVMDEREICAEKIRAVSDRARYRDFYDLYLLLQKFRFNIEDILTLVRKKEIRKPISKETIMSNWQIALKEKHDEIHRIFYLHEVPDEAIMKMLNSLTFENINA